MNYKRLTESQNRSESTEQNTHKMFGFILRCTGRIDDEKREKSLGNIRERTPESLKTGGSF